MVNTRSFFPTALLLVSAVAAEAAPQSHTVLTSVPYMPRIPSAAKHHEVLRARAVMEMDHSILENVKCLDPQQNIILHDETIALLSICGGMPGSIDRCQGAPTRTTGEVGTALFKVAASEVGAGITISKEQWMRCVQAARAECPAGSLEATCRGGASTGNVKFTLESPRGVEL